MTEQQKLRLTATVTDVYGELLRLVNHLGCASLANTIQEESNRLLLKIKATEVER